MERFLFISLYEPNRYGGRVGGTVVLPNDILNAVDPGLDVDLIVYQKDAIKSDLPSNIRFVPWSKCTKKLRKTFPLWKLPTVLSKDYSTYQINTDGYSRVIYFPYFCSLFRLSNYRLKIYTIGMDSGPMLYMRGLIRQRRLVMKAFCLYELLQSARIDKRAASLSEKVFTVGDVDAQYYKSVFQAKAYYVPHPVTPLVNSYAPIPWRKDEKLRVCLPGGMSRFYVAELLDEIIDRLCDKSNWYKDQIAISFLGRLRYRSLGRKLSKLEKQGVKVEFTDFAEDYENYLSNQHLILLPLVVGAGTKNKALSAFSMGLDVIGSTTALENVYGTQEVHMANTADEFLNRLDLRLKTRTLYCYSPQKIEEFRSYHSLEKWRRLFWHEVSGE